MWVEGGSSHGEDVQVIPDHNVNGWVGRCSDGLSCRCGPFERSHLGKEGGQLLSQEVKRDRNLRYWRVVT